MYDYIVVGAGLSGATFAQRMFERGARVLVFEQKPHVGGLCYTSVREGITCHEYGPHVFHTSDHLLWKHMSRWTTMRQFRLRVKATAGGFVYSFPVNLNTLQQLMGIGTPMAAEAYFHFAKREPKGDSAEDYLLSTVGPFLYEKLYKGYTEKMWGRPAKEVPSSIIKRIPVRTVYNDDYHSDTFQGLPVNGYTPLVELMLKGVDVKLGVTVAPDNLDQLPAHHKLVWTGPIDDFYDYCFGKLEYRSLRFDTEKRQVRDWQGCPVMNFCDADKSFTRITEHKHFHPVDTEYTYLTKEFPQDKGEPMYPFHTEENVNRYGRYRKLAEDNTEVIFLGRLGTYTYLNMDQAINAALKAADREP